MGAFKNMATDLAEKPDFKFKAEADAIAEIIEHVNASLTGTGKDLDTLIDYFLVDTPSVALAIRDYKIKNEEAIGFLDEVKRIISKGGK